MIPKCCEESSSDPSPGFVVDGTSEFQVKQSKEKQHLKACSRDKKEHIYLNVKRRTAEKQRRRQRTEEDKDTKNKGCPCPCCPEQWVTYRGKCYFFSKEKKDWNSSQESCRAQGAHLLVISDTNEMDFFQIEHTKSRWIGLQRSTDSDWVWEDSSKLGDKKVKSNSCVQNCAVLLDGAIHASSCEVPTPWICEKSV
ncbi:killer cell lectin-like receptor subfamily G member 1 isoform 2-T2 [Cyanocitta cristata]